MFFLSTTLISTESGPRRPSCKVKTIATEGKTAEKWSRSDNYPEKWLIRTTYKICAQWDMVPDRNEIVIVF